MQTDLPTLTALLARVEKAEGNDASCWTWRGAKDEKGRGRVWLSGKLELAHRAVWKVIRGPIPEGMMLCHHCDNHGCVNPDHIYIGTHADNMRDMRERKRSFAARNPDRVRALGRQLGQGNNWVRGEQNPKAKLSPIDVLSIRNSTRPTKHLAESFGVHRTTIQRIRNGRAWGSAPPSHPDCRYQDTIAQANKEVKP